MLRATVDETRRSFDLKGRTARAGYLAFLFCTTVLFALSLAICVKALPEEYVVTGMFVTTAIFYLPVTAAGVRRLHDVGKCGNLMLDPLKPIAALYVVMLLFWLTVANSDAAFIVVYSNLIFLGKVWFALFCIAALCATALTLMYFSNTMSMLLLPSQPGTNKYGPNPNEVSQ